MIAIKQKNVTLWEKSRQHISSGSIHTPLQNSQLLLAVPHDMKVNQIKKGSSFHLDVF